MGGGERGGESGAAGAAKRVKETNLPGGGVNEAFQGGEEGAKFQTKEGTIEHGEREEAALGPL